MKCCARCKLLKPEVDFGFKSRASGKRHYVCRACQSAYRKDHYQKNRSRYIEKAHRWNGEQRLKLEQFIAEWLLTHPCVDCGTDDIVVLEFDHISDKTLEISQMFRSGYSVEAVLQEIGKCVVRCANCHRKKTARERNDWRFRYKPGP